MKPGLTALLFLLGVATRAGAATIGTMTVRLPAPWKPVGVKTNGKPQAQTARWSAPGSKEVAVDFWPTHPPRDGGPMVVARKYPVTVAGKKTDLIQTSLFQGQKAQVLVVFLPRADAWYRIVGKNISVPEFETILATVVFTK